MKRLLIKRLTKSATIPTRATNGSAGFDLYADITGEILIHPNETVKVSTGIAISLEQSDVVGLVYARSGLATNHGITLANGVGVIDSDYRGELLVALFNQSQTAYSIQPKERIAQLVLTPIFLPLIEEVEELDSTKRGSGGFGSTLK